MVVVPEVCRLLSVLMLIRLCRPGEENVLGMPIHVWRCHRPVQMHRYRGPDAGVFRGTFQGWIDVRREEVPAERVVEGQL